LSPAVFQLSALPICPESPKYTLIVKNQEQQAEKGLDEFAHKNGCQCRNQCNEGMKPTEWAKASKVGN